MAQSVKRPAWAQVTDLTVREFEPCVGLCADSRSLEPASDSVFPSLSLFLPPAHALSLSFSLKNK